MTPSGRFGTGIKERGMAAGKNQKMVGLLGGSFNPPHIGHVEICRHLLEQHRCDRVWVIPCYHHPFGKKLAPYDARITMCRFTFQEFVEKVWVSDVERRMGGVSHTVKTIQHLQFRYPEIKFSLIVGGDVAKEKGLWKDYDAIREMVDIIEIPRGEDSPITDISSTEIRRRIRDGEKYKEFVVMPVAVYIVTHGLYHDS